jgi:hypothetical protein
MVADQRSETRKLLEYCGLEWEESCMAFHQNRAASMTASASQVRLPIYDSSIAQWRHYEVELAELSRELALAGIAI